MRTYDLVYHQRHLLKIILTLLANRCRAEDQDDCVSQLQLRAVRGSFHSPKNQVRSVTTTTASSSFPMQPDIQCIIYIENQEDLT